MPTYEEIGRRIREARIEQGLMQADLGRLLSRPRSHAAISDIERGRTKLNLDELAEVAALLDKSLSYITQIPTQEEVTQEITYYRRDQGELTESQKQRTTAAIEDFKKLARERSASRQNRG